MNNNIFFILAHQDDEMGLFNVIEKAAQTKQNLFVIYLTSGLKTKKENIKNKVQKRDIESLSVLLRLGVKKEKIIFLGKNLNIPVYHLYKNLDIAYREIEKLIKKYKGKNTIYTHTWEGGNEDHDSCYILVKKFILLNSETTEGFLFSQYHAHNANLFPFKIQSFISSNKKIYKLKLKFATKIKYIIYLFSYKSQIYLWLPLFSLIVLRIIFNNYGNLQMISKDRFIKKPHIGKLLYEKLRNKKYEDLRTYFSYFLKNL